MAKTEIKYAGNVRIDREALGKALSIAKLNAERRAAIPILNNVKLSAGVDALLVSTTNLDIELTVSVPAKHLAKDFAVTVPAHLADDLLRKAPKADDIEIISAGETERPKLRSKNIGETEFVTAGQTKFEFGRATYKIEPQPVADFPLMTNTKPIAVAFDMPGIAFRELIAAVRGGISTEETRYYLNGIMICTKEKKMIAVTTDGHRLYKQEIDAPSGSENLAQSIIPRVAVDLFMKLFQRSLPATVTLEFSQDRFRLSFDNVQIFSKLIDGVFPDYNRVIPHNNSIVVTLDGDEMIEALKAVAIIRGTGQTSTKLNIETNRITVSMASPDNGSAEMQVEATATKPLEIGFNNTYLREVMELTGANVEGRFEDSVSPTIFTTSARPGWLAVLIPMRA